MRKLVVLEYVSLDGVIQAPGHAGEDPAGGFAHGGWTGPFITQHPHFVAESFSAADGFLFGRLTYEIVAAYWPTVTDPGDPIAQALNTRPKYVAAASPPDPAWAGTTVLAGDVAGQVARLKAERAGSCWSSGAGSWPRPWPTTGWWTSTGCWSTRSWSVRARSCSGTGPSRPRCGWSRSRPAPGGWCS